MTAAERIGAEERVLSAWFYDQNFRRAWRPDPGLFALPAHRAMAEIMAARGPGLTDGALTLEMRRSDSLKLFPAMGQGSDTHGAGEIARIVFQTPTVLDPWQAVEGLRQAVACAALRGGLLRAVAELDGGSGLEGGEAAAIAALGAARGIVGSAPQSLRPELGRDVARLLGPPRAPGVSTGSYALDNATGGLRAGDCWAVGAPTSWGKSSLCTAFLRSAISRGARMLIVSGEDPVELYTQRIICGRTGVSATRARDATLRDDEKARVSSVLTGVEDYQFFINAIGQSAESAAADVRSVLASDPHERWIVAIDYIQAFRSSMRHQDRRIEIIHCGRLFTEAIKRAGACGILFSQVTRDASGKLKMREADDLIHAAEVGLYGEIEDEKAELNSDGLRGVNHRARSLRVAKIKNGPSGFSIPLDWDDESASFQPDHPWAAE